MTTCMPGNPIIEQTARIGHGWQVVPIKSTLSIMQNPESLKRFC